MKITIGGGMMGVSGMKCCDTCAWADISDGPRTIIKDNMTIVQNGKHNIACTNTGSKDIYFRGANMICSGWRAKDEKQET